MKLMWARKLMSVSIISYAIVGSVAVLLAFNLFGMAQRVNAANTSINVFTTVSAGVLDFVAASTSQSFIGFSVNTRPGLIITGRTNQQFRQSRYRPLNTIH